MNEKRAILASWASDACAVEAVPSLRRIPDGKHLVCFDGVMDALRALDKLSRVESRAATRASDRRDRRGQDPTDGGVRGYLGGSPQMNVAR